MNGINITIVTVIKNMNGINIMIVTVIRNMNGINIMSVTVIRNMNGINIMIVTVIKNMTVNLTGWTNMLIVIAAKSMTHAGSQKHCLHVIKNITIVKKSVIVIVNV
ncbi:hypothetical protein QUF49_12085 [Fictibacillus sp. b24]|uniref:hypothetical protein n=1 Tax=Fictibacillus sp. b24 TaxID=3055863 RepID=UPI0025A0D499|nr:hypothetical protein [Fictibacillus sp. b24]MDM5316737.1 hypothetical protein [Fictibacillus sp. b24]